MLLATAYLDTNFFSVLHYSGGYDVTLAQHLKTKEWWELERGNYNLFSSRKTEEELEQGVGFSRNYSVGLAWGRR